jgi:hypothetical protein
MVKNDFQLSGCYVHMASWHHDINGMERNTTCCCMREWDVKGSVNKLFHVLLIRCTPIAVQEPPVLQHIRIRSTLNATRVCAGMHMVHTFHFD